MARLSVIMAAYNGEPFVKDAIESILHQTFTDFEFIVIDDGSCDQTWSIIREHQDPRLISVRNRSNLGLTRTLNHGLELAQGQYIARQDADDISLPSRLERQVQVLDQQPSIGLLGTWWQKIDPKGRGIQHVRVPTNSETIRQRLPVDLVITHATVMFRRECVDAVGGYRLEAGSAEDLDLWLRISEMFDISNVPEELYQVRIHAGSIVASGLRRHLESIYYVLKMALERWEVGSRLAISPNTRARCHLKLACQDFLMGRLEGGTRNLMLAVEKDSSIAQNGGRTIGEIANFALYACKLAHPDGDSSAWERTGRRYVNNVVCHLPSGWLLDRNAIYARFLTAASYDSYTNDRFADAVKYALSSMRRDRSTVKNRHLWGLVLNSLVQRRVLL